MMDFTSRLPTGLPTNASLLPTLLDLLPLGVMYYTPVLDAVGALTDLALAYLNPAAQRMTGLPAQPGTTYRQQFPTTDDNGAWDFHRRTWLSGEPQHFQFYYDADGFDSYFRVASQRLGEGLLTIFTDTQDEVRSQAEQALLASQARERAARAEAEHQQAELRAVFEQAPVAIALLQGPAYVIEFANPRMAQLWGRPLAQVVGQPHFAALPDLVGQGFEAIFDAVWRTGEPHYLQEQAVTINRAGHLYRGYFNITYQPSYNGQGQRTGLITSAIEVTDQVLARQQVEQLNQELEAARAEAERERTQLQALLTQAPVAIALFQGEDFQVAAVNPEMAALWGHPLDQVRDRPLLEGVPELRGQGFDDLLQQVLATQVPFVGREVPAVVLRNEQLQTNYYNFVYQPLHDAEGQVLGIIDVAVDVTEQVLARQQLEQLNAELEARVQERTRELGEQQVLLGRILGQVPAAVATLTGPDHRFTFFNEQYQRLNEARSILGAALADVVPEATAHGFVALLDQVYRTGEPYEGSQVPVWLGPAGEAGEPSYYVDFRYQPLHDERGQTQGILIFAVDVTERVHARRHNDALQAELLATAQRQVQEREAFYQVFEQTPAAVSLLHGPQFRFEYVNPAYQQVFAGRPLLGLNFADTLPDAAAQGYLALLDRVYQTGETYFGNEIPFVSEQPGQPPRTLYFNFTYQAYREHGEIVGISSFAFDVTEQVQAKQQREAQRQLLATVFAQAPVALFVLRGAAYVFDIVNDSMGRMLDMDPAYMLGKRYFDLLPGLEAQGYRQLLDQVWHTGQEYVAQEQAARLPHHGEGETGYYTFTYVPLREAAGSISGIMCVAVDVTAQVLNRQQVQQLNDELQTSNTQLTRTNVDLDNFIYTASHDLKAPITNIEGLLLALEHELPAAARPGDVPLMLSMMQDAVERFRRTIAHLTDLSRLQKEHNLDADAVALAPVVEAVRLDLGPLLAQTQSQLTVTIPAGLTVTFAEKNLRSVVYNLLSNALKYHHPDRVPQVHLRAALSGDYTVLEVQDNGLGLDLSQGQERLFAMFQRLHTHVEGTGIGLYMVKRILENAGGRIEVQSELGQGSTFQIYFPR